MQLATKLTSYYCFL